MIVPGNEFAGGIEATLKEMESGGTIVIVVKIVFAGPEELDGNADLFGDGAGFEHVIVGEAAAESTAGRRQVDDDVVVGNIQHFGDKEAAVLRSLAGRPKFELAVVIVRETIFGIHGSVREEGIEVRGFDGFCGGLKDFGSVSVVAESDGGRLLGEFLGAAGKAFAALLRSCAFVPFGLQLFAGGVGLPPSVGDYGDAPMQAKQILRALSLKGMTHAWHGPDLVEVGPNALPPIYAALVIDGVQHSRYLEVDTVEIFPGDDLGVVDTVNGMADDFVVFGILELDGLEIGRGEHGGFFGERAIRESAL